MNYDSISLLEARERIPMRHPCQTKPKTFSVRLEKGRSICHFAIHSSLTFTDVLEGVAVVLLQLALIFSIGERKAAESDVRTADAKAFSYFEASPES